MFQLIYASSAFREMRHDELETILNKARAKNERLGITGMLLYRDGAFLQLLEGTERTVRRLYKTIARDERHRDVTVLATQQTESRDFEDWTMGFYQVEERDLDALPEGHTRFLAQKFDVSNFTEKPSHAQRVLLGFRNVPRSPSV